MKMSDESLAGATSESMGDLTPDEVRRGYRVSPEVQDEYPLRPAISKGIGPTPEQEWSLGGFLRRSEGFAR